VTSYPWSARTFGVLALSALLGVLAACTATATPDPGPECVIGPRVAATGTVALADSTTAPLGSGTALALTAVQVQYASTINAVGLAKAVPDRARTVALATALQETGLRNLTTGHLDSVGLFQQRPSQGWGTAAQIMDPVYSAGIFYQRLLKVAGWASMSITEAAQAVQHSAYPDAYAKWEPAADTLRSALSGPSPDLLSCRAGATPPTTPPPDRTPLSGTSAATPALSQLLAAAEAELGGLTAMSVAADGRSADIAVAVDSLGAADSAAVLASWSVAHATGGGVTSVTVGGRRWADHGWQQSAPARPPGRVEVAVG
jgi:hypothetical protein